MFAQQASAPTQATPLRPLLAASRLRWSMPMWWAPNFKLRFCSDQTRWHSRTCFSVCALREYL